MKNLIVRGKVPLRVSFAGGGTDVEPYSDDFGGIVLSSTIDWYAYATMELRNDNQVYINSLDYDTTIKYDINSEFYNDGQLDLVRAIVSHMQLEQGVNIFIHNDAPTGSGLGSSGAVGAMLVGMIANMQNKNLTKHEIAETALYVEREIVGVAGGKQDQFAATYGGINYIEFNRDDSIVNQLRIDEDTLEELEYHLMLVYTKKKHYSGDLLESQINRYKDKLDGHVEALHTLKDLTKEAKDRLVRGDLSRFGDLLHEAWLNKIKMNPLVTTGYVNDLYDAARSAGAKGGKILGAGGGGYMLLYTPFQKRKSVAEAVTKLGGQVVNFHFEDKGLKIWRTRKKLLHSYQGNYILDSESIC